MKTTNKKQAKVNDYSKQVLSVNRSLKEYEASLGACISRLNLLAKDGIISDPTAKRNIKNARKIYEQIKKDCRITKSGKYCAFYVLQSIYRLNKPQKAAKVVKAELPSTKQATKRKAAPKKAVATA